MQEWKADTDFDLTPFIDELPAAQFFWYDRITEAQKPRFLKLLGTLYQLFITPHFIPLPTSLDCSYLKKVERMAGFNTLLYIGHVFDLLKRAKNPELDVSDEVNVVWSSATNVVEYNFFTKEEEFRILEWYRSRKFKTLLIYASVITLTLEEIRAQGFISSHATFLVLRKTKSGSVQYMYVDPHGFSMQDTSFEVQQRFKDDLLVYLHNVFGPGVVCENVLDECPLLQGAEQGGNCAQWTLMMVALFISQPNLFDQLKSTLYKLSLYPTLNVHLFTLSVFLRTLPQVGLLNYLKETIVPSRWNEQVHHYCEQENLETLQAVSAEFGVPSCYLFRNCREPCFQQRRSCMFRTASDGRTFLSPKEIADKMLHLYAEIWDMTGHDPDSMTDEQIHEQLNFPDFVKREEDVDNFMTQFELTDADVEIRESLL